MFNTFVREIINQLNKSKKFHNYRDKSYKCHMFNETPNINTINYHSKISFDF